MKRRVSILLAVSTLTAVAFSGCGLLTDDTDEAGEEITLEEDVAKDWLEGYTLFNGSYATVKRDAVKKIVDDERYEEGFNAIAANSLGLDINFYSYVKKDAKGNYVAKTVSESTTSCQAKRESMTDSAYQLKGNRTVKANVIFKGAYLETEKNRENKTRVYADETNSYTKTDEESWEETYGAESWEFRLESVKYGIESSALQLRDLIERETTDYKDFTIVYSTYEDVSYTKVKVTVEGSSIVDGGFATSGGGSYTTYGAANVAYEMYFLFTKELKPVAYAVKTRSVSEQITNATQVGLIQSVQYEIVTPWSGTITKPTDLPTDGE